MNEVNIRIHDILALPTQKVIVPRRTLGDLTKDETYYYCHI